MASQVFYTRNYAYCFRPYKYSQMKTCSIRNSCHKTCYPLFSAFLFGVVLLSIVPLFTHATSCILAKLKFPLAQLSQQQTLLIL